MATHSSILAWRIPWTEEPGGLQFMGSQRYPTFYLLIKENEELLVYGNSFFLSLIYFGIIGKQLKPFNH